MKPLPRWAGLSAFLAVFSLGLWLVSLASASPWLVAGLGLLWWAVATLVGVRLLSASTPSQPEAPASFEPTPASAGEAADTELEVEALPLAELEAEPEPPFQSGEVYGLLADWSDFAARLEAEWSQPDPLGPGFEEILGNEAFIRENVHRSYEIAANLAGSAEHAFALSEKVQKGVVVVTDALMESLKQTEILSLHSERITGILALMAEVSDKIHVLSINASIVSARAGIAGRGFEVVAKEIRALAKESESSLGGIVEVIELLRSSIAQVIRVVRDADAETEQEKGALIEVAGALQGVSLGVEIVKAVSSFAQDKADEQDRLVRTLAAGRRGPTPETLKELAALKARLTTVSSKE